MKNFSIILTAIILSAALSGITACKKIIPADTSKQEAEAVKAAEAWLKLTDNKEYGKSWDEASELFKKAIEKNKWGETLEKNMTPFGKLVKREVNKKKYATSLPGAPDGEYVVIQFKSEFENKKEAIETVTPMKEKDGTWRVSGYYIK